MIPRLWLFRSSEEAWQRRRGTQVVVSIYGLSTMRAEADYENRWAKEQEELAKVEVDWLVARAVVGEARDAQPSRLV